MPRPKKPTYGTYEAGGHTYYRKRIKDADGKRVAITARTVEELEAKIEEAQRQIAEATFRKENPTVSEYADRWLEMQKIRDTTKIDYTSKVKLYIQQQPIGDMFLADVTPDDLKLHVLRKASEMSRSVYQSVVFITKSIFASAYASHIIDEDPAAGLSSKGGGKTPKERTALTDDQFRKLLDAIKGLPPYVFVMIGLYAGLRREEILALQWDCVDLDGKTPMIKVRRAWHTEHNRPVITDELKTEAARRDIPIPPMLVKCLQEAHSASTSDFVIASSVDGGALSYTQFKRVWAYITTRTAKPRTYTRYVNGEKIKHTVTPVLGESALHNGKVVYSLDFDVTPHQLRHTYITNLIKAGVDPKTVQYLAGHENSRITMDIYAHVNYNRPEDMAERVNKAFGVE